MESESTGKRETVMTDKELKKLRRVELLELLLDQAIEMERLQKQLEQAQEALACRQLQMKEAGSMADAARRLNDIFSSADRAAQDYLESIRAMQEREQELLKQTEEKCRAMEEETRIKCEALLAEASGRAGEHNL